MTTQILALLSEDVRRDLADEDPGTAIEIHFPPVRVVAMPSDGFASDDCSTDGFYDTEIDPTRPWIVYSDGEAPARVRFTLLHELGHHILATVGAHLLDDIDRIGRSAEGAKRTEELVCHQLAGRLLVPDRLVDEIIGSNVVVPRHVVELREQSNASWEASAVRAIERLKGAGAILLLREQGSVSFCAARGLEVPWWPRGSAVDPTGPMARALDSSRTAVTDTYRWDLGFARSLFCDTLPVHEGLAIAVLTERPSDGHFQILEDPEPWWRERIEYCEWCNEERTDGWCDKCKGKHCPECGRCGCMKRRVNPVCPQCGLQQPFRSGAEVCRDCEADA